VERGRRFSQPVFAGKIRVRPKCRFLSLAGMERAGTAETKRPENLSGISGFLRMTPKLSVPPVKLFLEIISTRDNEGGTQLIVGAGTHSNSLFLISFYYFHARKAKFQPGYSRYLPGPHHMFRHKTCLTPTLLYTHHYQVVEKLLRRVFCGVARSQQPRLTDYYASAAPFRAPCIRPSARRFSTAWQTGEHRSPVARNTNLENP
jgi:hypothetical protein